MAQLLPAPGCRALVHGSQGARRVAITVANNGPQRTLTDAASQVQTDCGTGSPHRSGPAIEVRGVLGTGVSL